MSEQPDAEQQTEAPSQHKLDQARERGQVASSREVNTWMMLLAGTGIILFLAPPAARTLERVLAGFVDPQRFLGRDGILWEAVRASLAELIWVMVLPLFFLMVAAVAGCLMQTGLIFATQKL